MKWPSFTGHRDIEGYEVRHYPTRARSAGSGTVIGGSPEGVHLAGKSGRNELVVVSNSKLWRRLFRITGPAALAEFMTEYGPLGRASPTAEYLNDWESLCPMVDRLRGLAAYAEAFDRESFVSALGGRDFVLQRLSASDSKKVSQNVCLDIGFRTLADFLTWQMWNACGERDHPSREVAKTCLRCGIIFSTGSGRGSGGRRADARYCSKRCSDAERKQRKRRENS